MLDKRYGGAYHYCRHCLREIAPADCGPMNVAPPAFCGPLSFTACSWSLTASYSTGPQIRNRCASRVQGLSNAVFSPSAALLPSAPTLAAVQNGATAKYNPLSHQEGKRRSESCPEFELKGFVCG